MLSDKGNYSVDGRHLVSMQSNSSGNLPALVVGLAPTPSAFLLWDTLLGRPRKIRRSGPGDLG